MLRSKATWAFRSSIGKRATDFTDKGAVFLDGARTLLDGLDETLARCREMGDPDATLRIAVQYPTPSFAAKLKERLSVPFAFVEHDYRDPIFQPIVNGTADIVLDYDYTPFASLVKGSERPRPGNENMLGLPHEYQHDGVEPFGKQARSFAQRP